MIQKLGRLLFLFCLAIAGLFIVIVAVTPDPFDPDDQAGADIDCKDHAQEVRAALDRYAESHQGQFPKSLKDLIPQQLSSLPQCRLAKSGFSYKLVGNKAELECSWHGQR